MSAADALLGYISSPLAAILAQEEEGGGLLGALGVNLFSFLWQLFAFLVLLFVLRKYAYRPVMNMLDERANRIRNSMETAERVQREMAEMEQRSRQMLEQSRRESQAVITQAQQTAERIQAQAQESARNQANEIVSRAQVEINRERVEAMAQLRREVADLAITAASRVVRRELDPQTHIRLINETLAESGATHGNGVQDGGRPLA